MSRREPAASPFRDVSNLRTPRPNPKPVPASPRFFTASKAPLQAPTPTPLRRRRPGDGAPTPTPLGRRLRALEVDQSRSARRAESGRESALRTFAASASSWLSLLLRDPSACGCSPAATASAAACALPCAAGKRDTLDGEWELGGRRGGGDRGGERRKEMTPAMVAALRDSLREVCSLEDVTERMGKHMSKGACEEVLVMMFQICKNIDDGRLKMKAHCPLVTDLRLKEKATRVFMCYNPHWLRIGLHIVLGGDSLLQSGLGKRDKEPALSEYDFTIRSLFEDIQDGIILCRVVQLLLSDASIVLKVIAPSDTNKKRLSNCTTSIQYIKKARVPLSDSDGVTILAEDIATGDKELILSLLWNVFIHMQLPLLASTSLAHELTRLSVPVMSMEQRMSENESHMDLIYNWVQVICSKYGISVESSCQFDRRALNCLVNYYLDIDIFPHKETQTGCRKELFTCHELDTVTDITSCPSSKMGKVLADVLQDIPASLILADGVLFDEKSAILLLAFLSSHLINGERLDQLKKLIKMKLDYESPGTMISARCRSQGNNDLKYQPPQTDNKDGSCTSHNQEWTATIIQSKVRSLIAKNKYCKRKRAIFILQGNHNRYFTFIMERHRFVQMRKSAVRIQQASYVKAYLVRKALKQEVAHIRSRLQKSSAQVDDSTATEYSKKCCETLVAVGAVDILLKQIHLLNRGVPDQEVLKQVFLTLRNIARYPNLRHVLVNTPGSAEIIFQELLRYLYVVWIAQLHILHLSCLVCIRACILIRDDALRNKAAGFFIASDILKKLYESKEGHETARALRHHIKRLRNLVQDLEKKVELDKR
ncbi:hypothetical protein BAE44_0022926 [Dichanthelium oligosanthes]|uniref:Calponin-homology (CH) domain-containing protein n=1 Tax=Dichanthelium oligosanthes TaxID=888268 RepID=A0A1E5UT66_9POAL|nr:hypothetical protein BAE44_0022926 [Dichanthelium oligosanthes]